VKYGTYDCVICISQSCVGLRIAIWCETPWRRSQHNLTLQFIYLNVILINGNSHCTLWTFKSYLGFCEKQTKHHIHLPSLGKSALFCTLSQVVEGFGHPFGVVWDREPSHPPLTCALGVYKVEILYCQSTECLGYLSVLFHCHLHGAMSSSSSILLLFEGIPKSLTFGIQLLGTWAANCAYLQKSNAYSKLCLILYTVL